VDVSRPEFVDPIRHLDQVRLARDSGEVTQGDQERPVVKNVAQRD
jgi:hypothetical protein